MANLYFNAAVDTDWATLGNWWQNAGHSVAAGALPASGDTVYINADCLTNSGSDPTVANLYATYGLEISITVTGAATFSDSAYIGGTLTGNATFNNSAYNNGTVSGDATFGGESYNVSTCSSSATFNDSSYNNGSVTGEATFNGSSYNVLTCSNATFNNSSYNAFGSNVQGNATFNDNATNWYAVGGDVTFNDYATADDTGAGVVTANDYAYIYYSILANPASATFNDYSTHGNGFVSHYNTMNDNSFVNNQGYAGGDYFTFNDNSYGGVNSFVELYVNGNPIVMTTGIIAYLLTFGFVRRSGINGSSILGVM